MTTTQNTPVNKMEEQMERLQQLIQRLNHPFNQPTQTPLSTPELQVNTDLEGILEHCLELVQGWGLPPSQEHEQVQVEDNLEQALTLLRHGLSPHF